MKHYFWEDPFLYKHCPDKIIRSYALDEEMTSVLHHYHLSPYTGHFRENKIASKVLQLGFYWRTLFRDADAFVVACDRC